MLVEGCESERRGVTEGCECVNLGNILKLGGPKPDRYTTRQSLDQTAARQALAEANSD